MSNRVVQIWAYKPSDSATYFVERVEQDAYDQAARHNEQAVKNAADQTARNQKAENKQASNQNREPVQVPDVVPVVWTVHTMWRNDWEAVV